MLENDEIHERFSSKEVGKSNKEPDGQELVDARSEMDMAEIRFGFDTQKTGLEEQNNNER